MLRLRSALFLGGWAMLTLGFGLLCLPTLLSRRAVWAVARVWVALTLAWLRLACGVRSEVRGRAHLPAQGILVAAKHQSTWDTLMLWRELRNPAFVLKRELYRIPVFGWYLRRAGQIAIDRRSGRSAMRTILDAAAQVVAEGRALVIFPEGTRLRAGEEKPFHPGVARLSHGLQLPVIPAALNAANHWPRHDWLKHPGTAVLEFLSPMPPFEEPMLPWLAHLQQAVNVRTAQLEKEMA